MRRAAGREQAGRAGKKGGLHSAIAEEIETEVEWLIGDGVLNEIDFPAIEIEARRVALQVMGQAVAGKLKADQSDDRLGRSATAEFERSLNSVTQRHRTDERTIPLGVACALAKRQRQHHR